MTFGVTKTFLNTKPSCPHETVDTCESNIKTIIYSLHNVSVGREQHTAWYLWGNMTPSRTYSKATYLVPLSGMSFAAAMKSRQLNAHVPLKWKALPGSHVTQTWFSFHLIRLGLRAVIAGLYVLAAQWKNSLSRARRILCHSLLSSHRQQWNPAATGVMSRTLCSRTLNRE